VRSKKIELKADERSASGLLLEPKDGATKGVLLAHGAGGNMNAPFITYFHTQIAEAGYPCLKFNFFYSEAHRKAPDPLPLLIRCYQTAIEWMPEKQLIIGGKSMGGRIASYLADHPKVQGLFFLGYPLHPPGQSSQLRDQHLYNIRKPMLFISGTRDPFAQMELLQQTLRKIGAQASSFFIPQAGHSFEVPRSVKTSNPLVEASAHLVSWLKKTF
jgi:uncharacterized protein